MSSLINTKLSDICHMAELFDTSDSVLFPIMDPIFRVHDVRVTVKRDDLIDSEVSGNKWRKLKYNILQCQQYKNEGILTFGGAYSNHLVATAAACKKAGLKSVGVVRGDELNKNSSDTLSRCDELGMHLHFISREEYHLKEERYYHEELLQEFSNLHVVPEGGANYWGMIGCQELVQELHLDFDRIVLAQGTTTTSCGVLMGLETEQKCTVVPVLKGFDSAAEMQRLFKKSGIDAETTQSLLEKTEVLDDYHFGGYAKYDEQLIEFIRSMHTRFSLKFDPVYTGKALFALYDQIQQGKYDGESIVFIHTGGLQGISGIEKRLGEALFA
ncbi:MAG: 1-aminocyclopropane-1-carboxylate deaminase/D-cysteine desulfhydrase [Fluviicola sp.]